MIRLLSPMSLLSLTWLIAVGIAWSALALPDTFDLLPLFMARSGIDADRFGLLGGMWLVVAMLAALVGSMGAQLCLGAPRAFRVGVDADRAARQACRLTGVFVSVTALWITLSVPKAGGPGHFLHLAIEEPAVLRAVLLGNTLFPGMRLFYGALPALACLATGLLASGALSRQGRRRARRVLLLCAVFLLCLPVVLSQRILLMQFLISAWLAFSLARGRLRGLALLPVVMVLFGAVWGLREALTNPTISDPALKIASQKFAFYFVNDLWNSFAPFEVDIPHALGGVTFRGPLILMGLDGVYDQTFPRLVQALEEARGGGEFSLFSGPYVDFGPVGGVLFVGLAVFLARVAFHRARERLVWSVLYAQIGAALLFAPHGNYILHQNLIFGALCVLWVCRAPRRRAAPMTRGAADD
ncbi:O-antigen polymerase [Roseivivax sp. CAU 1753]